MIQTQRDNGHEPPRFYAYCQCGVCGPIRWSREDAKRDEQAHADVCLEVARG